MQFSLLFFNDQRNSMALSGIERLPPGDIGGKVAGGDLFGAFQVRGREPITRRSIILCDTNSESAGLVHMAITSYDSQGQVWQTQEYSVNPSTGAVSSTALTIENYYDPDGQLIATSAPGGLWTKDTYNGAGWQVMQYQTDGGSGTTYSEAGSITSDVVLPQSENLYDDD